MAKAGVPLLSGYHGEGQDPQHLLAEARKIGFPVMIKAARGGGGRGTRTVHAEGEFLDLLEAAKREAMRIFGDDNVLLEKWIARPRHIEMQIFGDTHGNYLHLHERDCTVRRSAG